MIIINFNILLTKKVLKLAINNQCNLSSKLLGDLKIA